MWDLLATTLLLVLGLLAALVLLGLLRVVLLRRRHRATVDALAPARTAPASLLGRASAPRDARQPSGSLVLATAGPDAPALALVPPRGSADPVVPLAALTSVTTAPSFRGRTVGRDLLVVTWDGERGADAAAFVVPDPATWAEDLRARRG